MTKVIMAKVRLTVAYADDSWRQELNVSRSGGPTARKRATKASEFSEVRCPRRYLMQCT